MAECLPNMREALGSSSSPTYPECDCAHLSLQHFEVEAGESDVQGHFRLYKEFKNSLRKTQESLKKQNTQRNEILIHVTLPVSRT